MNIDWEKFGNFVSSVGVPAALIFLFLAAVVAPFVLVFLSLLKKYGPRLAESHINFMESAERTQEQNANTLARLESTVKEKHADHTQTHHAIGLVAQAGISMLDNDHQGARTKLERVELVLTRKDAK
jgi:uncharacterized membrane protein YhiD involved in acid resistance